MSDRPSIMAASRLLKTRPTKKSFDRRFRSAFGVNTGVAKALWNDAKLIGTQPRHMLVALEFLQRYNSEESSAAFFNLDEKTIRKYRWLYVKAIASLKLVMYCKLINLNYASDLSLRIDFV